jgi:hypothetical protein
LIDVFDELLASTVTSADPNFTVLIGAAAPKFVPAINMTSPGLAVDGIAAVMVI